MSFNKERRCQDEIEDDHSLFLSGTEATSTGARQGRHWTESAPACSGLLRDSFSQRSPAPKRRSKMHERRADLRSLIGREMLAEAQRLPERETSAPDHLQGEQGRS